MRTAAPAAMSPLATAASAAVSLPPPVVARDAPVGVVLDDEADGVVDGELGVVGTTALVDGLELDVDGVGVVLVDGGALGVLGDVDGFGWGPHFPPGAGSLYVNVSPGLIRVWITSSEWQVGDVLVP